MTSTTSQQRSTASDSDRLKSAQRDAWSAGDFARVARHTVYPGELLCEAVNIRAGCRVLDVATGSGNAALSAARRGAEAVGVDYVPGLLECGRKRSLVEQVDVEFKEGDCEALPFADSSFDVALSMFGSMFAPDHQRAADELVRVCRPGGQIGLASWTPSGFWGRVFALQSKFIPLPPGLTAPTAWGTEDHLSSLFGDRVTVVHHQLRHADFNYASADEWLDFFATYFGPVLKAFERLDGHQTDAFAAELKELADEFNCAENGGLVVRGEYREDVLMKQ